MLVNRSLTEDEVSFREEGARTTLMRNEPKVENCFSFYLKKNLVAKGLLAVFGRISISNCWVEVFIFIYLFIYFCG